MSDGVGYQAKFAELRGKLVETLGNDTIDVLLERAVREVASAYPAFELNRDESEVLHIIWNGQAQDGEPVRAAFSALYAAMLIILARLLGKEIAVRLASALDADLVMEGQQIAPA